MNSIIGTIIIGIIILVSIYVDYKSNKDHEQSANLLKQQIKILEQENKKLQQHLQELEKHRLNRKD